MQGGSRRLGEGEGRVWGGARPFPQEKKLNFSFEMACFIAF